MPLFEVVLHVVVLLLLPPLLLGIVVKTKAAFAGRRGAPLLQVYFDIWKLLRKQMVLSHTTTFVFAAGPIVTLVTVLLAGLLVPLGGPHAPLGFTGDLVLFAYLLGIGRFFTVLSAFDTGSAFEGMGATRELTFSCLSEPALFLGLLVLAKIAGATSLGVMFGAPGAHFFGLAPASVALVLVSVFIVVLAENCRIPVDDPTTHLELTMIHEVMVLDHSGPLLGVILYGAAMKLLVLSALLVRIVLPLGAEPTAVRWFIFVGLVAVMGVGIGTVESVMARLPMRHVPRLLVAACLLSGFGLILLSR